eukprot:gene9457-19640_t
MDDEPVSVVPNTGVGGGRAITPSKSCNPSKRYNTPQRSGSAPRSSSAPKGAVLARAVLDAQPFNNRSQSSRRKQRRWDNDNLFGMHRHLRKTIEDDMDESIEESALHNFGLQIEWRSAFRDILHEDNKDALQEYLKCAEFTKNHHIIHHHARWSETEKGWNRIEKKLRSIIVRAMKTDSLKFFLNAIEQIIILFVLEGITPNEIDTPEVLLLTLASPLEANEIGLYIHLQDSSFHRLLTHAACQFHGLKSKSITINNRKVMLISRPKDIHDGYAEISLVNYLIATSKKRLKNEFAKPSFQSLASYLDSSRLITTCWIYSWILGDGYKVILVEAKKYGSVSITDLKELYNFGLKTSQSIVVADAAGRLRRIRSIKSVM